jgi:hypothetical protein
MKEIDFRDGLPIQDLIEKFRAQTKDLIPGDWKFVGIQFHFVEEEMDILASPGFYSKGFDKEDFEEA